MTRKEIRKSIEDKVKELGVKDTYKYFVLANAKVIKPQMKELPTDKDKAVFINLSHSITVKGFKDANMLSRFSELFFQDNVIYDEVWDYVFEDLSKIAYSK